MALLAGDVFHDEPKFLKVMKGLTDTALNVLGDRSRALSEPEVFRASKRRRSLPSTLIMGEDEHEPAPEPLPVQGGESDPPKRGFGVRASQAALEISPS